MSRIELGIKAKLTVSFILVLDYLGLSAGFDVGGLIRWLTNETARFAQDAKNAPPSSLRDFLRR